MAHPPLTARASSTADGLLVRVRPHWGVSADLPAFFRTRHGLQADFSDAELLDHGEGSKSLIELPPADGQLYHVEVTLYDPDGDRELLLESMQVLHDTVAPSVGECELAGGAASVATTDVVWPCEASDGSGVVRLRTFTSPDCVGSQGIWTAPEIPSLHFAAFGAVETATLEGSIQVADEAGNGVCINDSVSLSRTFVDLGQITEDQTLDAGSYYLTDDFEVAKGVTLTLAPGVTLASDAGARALGVIAGTLVAEGTAGNPIVLQHVNLATEGLSLAHVSTLGTELWMGIGELAMQNCRMTQSDLFAALNWGALVQHNVFHQSHVDLRCGGASEILENRFTASPLQVHHCPDQSITGNSFLGAGEAEAIFSESELVVLDEGPDVSLQSNYWGTTDPDAIDALVRDSSDDLGLPEADTSNPLNAPHPNAP